MGLNLISLYLHHRVQVNTVICALSFLLLNQDPHTCEYVTTGSLFNLAQINHLSVNSAQIQAESSRDINIILSKVLHYTIELTIHNMRESQSLSLYHDCVIDYIKITLSKLCTQRYMNSYQV